MTTSNLKIHDRAIETNHSVAIKIKEAIKDNPFLNDNIYSDYSPIFEFNKEIETEIKHHLELWGVDLNDLEFMDVEDLPY